MISTKLSNGKRRCVLSLSRRVYYRIDNSGRPKRSVYSPKFSTLLKAWGVWFRKPNYGGHRTDRIRPLNELTANELADLHDRAKAVYTSRIAAAHPDRGGDPELAAAINTAWDNTERLFRRYGLEI